MLRLGVTAELWIAWVFVSVAAYPLPRAAADSWCEGWERAPRSTLAPNIPAQDLGFDVSIALRGPLNWQAGPPQWAADALDFDANSENLGGPATGTDAEAISPRRRSEVQWRKPLASTKPDSTAHAPLLVFPKTNPGAEPESPARIASQPSSSVSIADDASPEAAVDDAPETTAKDDSRADRPVAVEADEALADADDAVASQEQKSPAARPLRPGLQRIAAPALPPLSRNQVALRDKIRKVLKYYYQRPLNTGDRSPWEVIHWLLAYEVHSQVLQGGPDGEPITAVGWVCFNQACKGRSLLYLDNDDQLRVRVGPALQGHHGQLLAMLAQARVKSDYPIRVEGRELTIEDLIDSEKLTCYPRTELTFKLIGLQQYLDIEETWINDQGMTWDFPTMIREEMRQPVRTAACGGTHRLGGLALAVKKRERSGLPVDGEYAQAKRLVANYQNYAYRLQNSDGSLSTEWFRGPGAETDVDRRLKTTGHTLEWLIYAADEKQLAYYRTVRAVNYLCNLMWAHRSRDWEAGPLGHAIHALVLYDRLVFAPHDAKAQGTVAGRENHRR